MNALIERTTGLDRDVRCSWRREPGGVAVLTLAGRDVTRTAELTLTGTGAVLVTAGRTRTIEPTGRGRWTVRETGPAGELVAEVLPGRRGGARIRLASGRELCWYGPCYLAREAGMEEQGRPVLRYVPGSGGSTGSVAYARGTAVDSRDELALLLALGYLLLGRG